MGVMSIRHRLFYLLHTMKRLVLSMLNTCSRTPNYTKTPITPITYHTITSHTVLYRNIRNTIFWDFGGYTRYRVRYIRVHPIQHSTIIQCKLHTFSCVYCTTYSGIRRGAPLWLESIRDEPRDAAGIRTRARDSVRMWSWQQLERG